MAAVGPNGPSSAESNAGAIAGWNTTEASNGAWDDAVKTLNDPCPSGFRMPTLAQWQAVYNTILNPIRSHPGTWFDNSTNYSSGLRIGTGTTGLFLPAAGSRTWPNGELAYRGYFGFYWSSSGTINNVMGLNFSTGNVGTVESGSRNNGFSVRCISE